MYWKTIWSSDGFEQSKQKIGSTLYCDDENPKYKLNFIGTSQIEANVLSKLKDMLIFAGMDVDNDMMNDAVEKNHSNGEWEFILWKIVCHTDATPKSENWNVSRPNGILRLWKTLANLEVILVNYKFCSKWNRL